VIEDRDETTTNVSTVIEQDVVRVVVDRMRVIVVVGIGLGVLVGGVGGRLAMFVLRLTSNDRVRGVISDDGFEIGTFTRSGTYGLLVVGAGAGLIGAATYLLVRPWLIGPAWFRVVTCAAGSGAVVGSMLVHADGVDFTLLGPRWFAVLLFVLVPAIFGALVVPAVGWVEDPRSVVGRGRRRRWMVPLAMVLVVPPTAVLLAFIAMPVTVISAVAASRPVRRLGSTMAAGLVVRAAWLAIAVLGLVVLVADTRQIL
jgi:hypothetical protein